eukprot:TRINITY_DN101384_c0_g1_i1.p1 TRINITY_DN101384_c0_g1~~TRINITY_DN101384_c0_g1_i1.p1  ORF type:complete len:269 (-),score=34.69 TRINITY_DN101384_c0_g1_i1:71-877(-)
MGCTSLKAQPAEPQMPNHADRMHHSRRMLRTPSGTQASDGKKRRWLGRVFGRRSKEIGPETAAGHALNCQLPDRATEPASTVRSRHRLTIRSKGASGGPETAQQPLLNEKPCGSRPDRKSRVNPPTRLQIPKTQDASDLSRRLPPTLLTSRTPKTLVIREKDMKETASPQADAASPDARTCGDGMSSSSTRGSEERRGFLALLGQTVSKFCCGASSDTPLTQGGSSDSMIPAIRVIPCDQNQYDPSGAGGSGGKSGCFGKIGQVCTSK